jgi:signal transduction histidine kinase
MKAVADIDNYGRCISIKGIIQNIDLVKKSENDLKSSLSLVNHQNKRLQNFAFIVSHNLRSYVSNLRFMVNLYEAASQSKDQQEIFSNIKTISESLNTTIQHLNEIVKIDAEINQEKTRIEFNLLFKNIVSSLQSDIQSTNAIINYDFSKCPHIYYLPAYLESIFHNLLTNALKYRHPERRAIIKCESKKENNHIFITFEDNGVGINLEKYGNKIFGMYQTFHKHEDSQGIGLYITRNQVEAMGGSISVESTVNVGTKFIIKLV